MMYLGGQDMVKDVGKPDIKDDFLTLSDRSGLGIEELNDEVLREHINPKRPGLWESTHEWDNQWAHDRIWS
ncbi:hypothetical protein SH1V18_36580 [Vallitalea longa]|uniref:Uncharacterized protein n=1 Tax=Vallitalea longa TaxID=2936439 RepID=A0A9W5YF59_9FIRM|nr:hypothetical protein [Vallitalea longa]GKX31178.1 hypothetical protein SH1V18_36580 [Vallitalea longa]